MTRTADPLGGSCFVEAITDETERAVLAYMAVIDEHGGPLAAIESGWIRGELDDAAYKLAWALETGAHTGRRQPIRVCRRRRHVPRASRHRRNRTHADRARTGIASTAHGAAVERCLDRLRVDAREGNHTLPAMIDAIRNYATVDEVCGALSDVWGRYRMSTQL